jgi:hypothetical protein
MVSWLTASASSRCPSPASEVLRLMSDLPSKGSKARRVCLDQRPVDGDRLASYRECLAHLPGAGEQRRDTVEVLSR